MKELNQLLGIIEDAITGVKSKEDIIKDFEDLRDSLESELDKHPLHKKYKDMTIAELEQELLKQLKKSKDGSKEFDRQLNEQCRNLMLKSGLDIELPLKKTKINKKRIELDMVMLEEAGFSVGMMNLDDMDNIFVLEKDGIPTHCFLEIHDGEHHAITEIFEVIDGDISKTLESIFE